MKLQKKKEIYGCLAELSNGLEGFHIDNENGFAIDLQDAVAAKLTQGADHIFCGHSHILCHLFSGKWEIEFL